MPKVAYNPITQFNDAFLPEPVPQEVPSWGETFSSAFKMENDVYAAWDLLTRPQFDREDDWGKRLRPWLEENDLWEYRDNFLGTKSEAEASSILQRIREEEESRDILNRSGWGGVGAQIIAGTLSPVSLLPMAAGGRGATAFARAAALGLGAGAIQEVPLQIAQETRMLEESALSIAISTIVGGLLGGAAQIVGREGMEELGRALQRDMATQTNWFTIPQPAGSSTSRAESPGTFKDALGAITAMKKLSPVLRTIEQQTSPIARWMMTQLSDAGLVYEKNVKNVPTSPFGTVENLEKLWWGNYVRGIKALDENYNAFVFDGNVPGFAANVRAVARGISGGGEKSQKTFREAVARAMRNGDEGSNEYVTAAAKALRKEVYDPLLKAAQEVGIIKAEVVDLKGDISYLFRGYDRRAIEANYKEFLDTLSAHFEQKLNEDFASKVENFKKAQLRDEELIEDLKVPADRVEEVKDQYGARLKEIEEGANTQHFQALEETIANLRSLARAARGTREEGLRRQYLQDARDMERSAGEGFSKFKADRRNVKRRLSNLNKAQAVLEERVAKKLDKIDRAEELSIATLQRFVNKAQRLLTQLDRLSDENFEKGASELRTLFEQTARQYDKGEERIVKAAADTETPIDNLLALDAAQRTRAEKLTDVAERLDNLESMDRGAARELIEDALQETFLRANDIVGRRAVRAERLRAEVAKLSPDELSARIEGIRRTQAQRAATAEERILRSGADNVDLTNGTANFARVAREASEEVAKKITGVQLRLPAFEIMQGERGAELARVLDIPSNAIEKFLENDVEELTKRYVRTLAPDIEIAKKFNGSFNAQEAFDELLREESAAKEAAQQNYIQRKKDAAAKAGKDPETLTFTDEELQAAGTKVANEYREIKRDLAAVVGRLRNTHGLPTNPDGMAYRLGRLAMQLNTLRMMGGVVTASYPDVGRPVMKHGIINVFKNAFIPLISSMRALKMSKRELELAGGALDVFLHSRAQGLFDIMADLGRGSKFERGVEFANNKMGIIALFDYWTTAMKQYAGLVTNGRLMDSIRTVVEGGSEKAQRRAVEFLNAGGIDIERARDIWQNEVLQNGGADKVGGVWWPNTESWKNPDNVRAYRSALVRDVDNTIVTPGVERPIWTDATMPGRMLAQFKSFTFSSNSKTLLAGLQQRDMAFLNGVMVSLAFGALSYYTWASLTGGDAQTEMQNAGLDKWADEMIDRSGLMGILSEVQNVAQKIPFTQPYSSFSGGRQTRRGGSSLVEALMGPSFDLVLDSAKVVSEIDDPTQSTLHTLRTMAPLQNFFLLSRLFTAVEQAAGEAMNLPENRR